MESTTAFARSSPTLHETTPLLSMTKATKGTAKVVPMRYGQIWRITGLVQRAFTTDSLALYFNSSDTSRFRIARNRITLCFAWIAAIRQRRILTIDEVGGAMLTYSTPENNKNPWYVRLAQMIAALFVSAETKKRRATYSKLIGTLTRDAFGERLRDMYEIIGLATDPDLHGRGYGSALVKHVLRQSDAEGRDTWLVTSDAWHFYETLGFVVARYGVLGADNPAWKGEPVAIRIMHRPAKESNL